MNSLAKTDPKKRQNGHFLTVKHVKNLTPNMLRVTLNCPSLTDMDASRQGALANFFYRNQRCPKRYLGRLFQLDLAS